LTNADVVYKNKNKKKAEIDKTKIQILPKAGEDEYKRFKSVKAPSP